MLRTAVQIGAIVCVSSVVQAGVVVELVPDNPGPYFGGESVTVDVRLNSELSWPVLLGFIQFDFSDSDPALGLDATFAFNFSAVPSGGSGYLSSPHPELPVPWAHQGLDCGCPGEYFQLPAHGSLLIGSIGVQLPSIAGTYRIDMLNADEPDELFGAAIRTQPFPPDYPAPSFYWRAFTGDITGGAHDLVVIPEPATGMLVFAGMLGVLSASRRRRRRSSVSRIVMLRSAVQIGAIVCVSSVVQAGVVVELVPDNPGPYFGGETVMVDVRLNSDVSWPVLLGFVQLDFSDSDPGLGLDSTFSFDFSAVPSGGVGYIPFLDPELPVPRAVQGPDCGCPGNYFPLPGDGSLLIGSIGVQLPSFAGGYRIDLLNTDEPDEAFGAAIWTSSFPPDYPGPDLNWRAFTGDITGGTYDFVVIPEPATGILLFAGMLGALSASRRRRRRSSVRRIAVLRTAVQFGAIVCVSSVVQAGVVVELVPDNPGPYFGGESLTVDVWLQSQEPSDVELRTAFFDFSETDSGLALDSTFEFDLSSVTSGAVYSVFADLPRPGISFTPDIGTPLGFLLVLPAIDPLHIGSFDLGLPSSPGVYRVDTLNADQPDLTIGGALFWANPGAAWLAFTGDITGGAHDFVVIPEPATGMLLFAGIVGVLSVRRRRRGRPDLGRALVLAGVLAFAGTASAEPMAVPAGKVPVAVDSGLLSAAGSAGGSPCVQLIMVAQASFPVE